MMKKNQKPLTRIILLFSINNGPAPTLMPTLMPTHEPTPMPTHEPTRYIGTHHLHLQFSTSIPSS